MENENPYNIVGGYLLTVSELENADEVFADKTHRIYFLKTIVDLILHETNSLENWFHVIHLFTPDDLNYLNSPFLDHIYKYRDCNNSQYYLANIKEAVVAKFVYAKFSAAFADISVYKSGLSYAMCDLVYYNKLSELKKYVKHYKKHIIESNHLDLLKYLCDKDLDFVRSISHMLVMYALGDVNIPALKLLEERLGKEKFEIDIGPYIKYYQIRSPELKDYLRLTFPYLSEYLKDVEN